jgi:hypothetical protein
MPNSGAKRLKNHCHASTDVMTRRRTDTVTVSATFTADSVTNVIGRRACLPVAEMASQFTVTAISAASHVKETVEIIAKESSS